MDKRLFWDGRILNWEKKRYRNSFLFRSSIYTRREHCVSLMSKFGRPGMKVIDLGCGSGTLAERLPQDILYEGWDFSSVAIKQAEEKFFEKKNFTFRNIDLTVENGPIYADVIIGLGLVDWLEPREFERILKRCHSPKIIFSYSSQQKHWFRKVYDIYAQYFFQRSYTPHFYTSNEIQKVLATADYQMSEEIIGEGMLFGGLVLATK